MKYFDVFSESGFHSAFMTTYTFTAQAFEDIPFPKLRGAGCRNIAVLADKSRLNLSFSDYGPPRYAGSLYHIAKVSVGGAFHPKITVLLGEKKGRLLIGSANLTAVGLAGNKELVADLRFSEEAPSYAHFFAQVIEYIERYCPPDDPWLPEALDRAYRHTPWLRRTNSQQMVNAEADLSLLLDRPDLPILEQIRTATGDDQIDRLVVLSPYWDDELEGLSRLRTAFGEPPTDVLIEARVAQFPASALDRFSGVSVFDLNDESSGRFLHAKLIVAQGRKWDHVISGSLNCSLPALLGSTISNGNAEAGIYKRVLAGTALPALRLDAYGDSAIDPTALPMKPQKSLGELEYGAIDGGGFELRGTLLRWKPPTRMPSEPRAIQLFDIDGNQVGDDIPLDGEERYIWTVQPGKQRPRTAKVHFVQGQQSVPAIVDDIEALDEGTLPPRHGRLRQFEEFLSGIEFEGADILEAINELERLELIESEQHTHHNHSVERVTADVQHSEIKPLTYDAIEWARKRADAAMMPIQWRTSLHAATSADILSERLNKLIGLVSVSSARDDEADFRRHAAIDLHSTEPVEYSDNDLSRKDIEIVAQENKTRRLKLATAKKIHDAITAFEKRTVTLRGQRIKSTELVMLRTLLQVVLTYSTPVNGNAKAHYILPLKGKEGDWPRLLGRLLRQHFGVLRVLENLELRQNELEQHRMLEFLAIARFAAKMAIDGARAASVTNPLLRQLDPLTKLVETQVDAAQEVLGINDDHMKHFSSHLNDRFGELNRAMVVSGSR